MVAVRKLEQYPLIDQLRYWRAIRLDFPHRKAEAIARIDELLERLGEQDNGT